MPQHRFPSGPKKVLQGQDKNNLCVCPLRIESHTSMIYTMYIVQYTWAALILVSSVCLYTILQRNQWVSWHKKVECTFKVPWWFMLTFSPLNIYVNMAPESHQRSEARYIFSSDRAHNAIFNSEFLHVSATLYYTKIFDQACLFTFVYSCLFHAQSTCMKVLFSGVQVWT